MKTLAQRIWTTEPVVFVGALVSAWTALVAFDQAMDTFTIPVWVYVVAIPLVAFLTAVTRKQVSPVV